MRRSIIILLAFSLLLTSCRYFGGERIYGNRNIVNRTITVNPFNAVKASGDVKLVLEAASENLVRVETDENLLEFLDIYTDNDELVIKTRKGFNLIPSRELIVHVSAPEFRSLRLSGSGEASSKNTLISRSAMELKISGSGDMNLKLETPKLKTTISGSGSLVLNGAVIDFSTTVNGSGNVESFGLATDHVSVDIAGSADAKVFANKSLDINIAGSGNVQYKGNPQVKQHVAGSGSVEKVG